MGSDLNDEGRAVVARRVNAPASSVWAVLADGWFYANWVVGTSRVRDVDSAWPAVGSKIHHSFGLWPAVVDDETVALESVPQRRLSLNAKGWPAFGEARVDLTIEDSGTQACVVRIVEDAVAGPGKLLPRMVRQPLIAVRNRESLRRLALLAEGRQPGAVTGR